MITFNNAISFVSTIFNEFYFNKLYFAKLADIQKQSTHLIDKDNSINIREFKHTIVFGKILKYKKVCLNKINILLGLKHLTHSKKMSSSKYNRGVSYQKHNLESNRFWRTFKIFIPTLEIPP